MRFRSLVPWLLVAAPVAASSFGCWGATQVTVVLSTDLVCDGTLDTVVYKGATARLDATPNAETKSCTPASQNGADNAIGTLTLTPSAEKDGTVEVKAVLARNGKDPARCAADPLDCITATRTFSFVEHASQKVSIRLLEDCVGTVCPDGQTCIGGGQCSSNQATCADTGGCVDAGVDGGTDVTLPDGSRKCELRGPKSDGVLARSSDIPGPQLSTLIRGAGATILWVDKKKGFTSVPVDGSSDSTSLLIGTSAVALADGRDGRLVSIVPKSAMTMLTRGTSSMNVPTAGAAESVAATADMAVIGTKNAVYTVAATTGVSAPLAPPVEGQRVAIAGSIVYAGSPDGLHAYDASSMTVLPAKTFPRPLSPMGSDPIQFAVTPDGTVAFAAGTSPSGQVTIVDLPGEGSFFFPQPFPPQPSIRSLAVDGAHIYWTHESDGISYVSSGAPQEVLRPSAGGKIDHLAVDGDCVYFWETTANQAGTAALRAITKPK